MFESIKDQESRTVRGAAELDLGDETLDAMRALLPGLADEVVAAVIAEVPTYTGALSGRMGTNIRRAVRTALGNFLDLVGGDAPEDAVIRALRTANDLGWQPENLLANRAIARGLDRVDDPAALLAWRINKRTRESAPPTPTRDPEPTDVVRWRAIVRAAYPTANLDNPAWLHAWRVAAAAPINGLNPDTAVRTAAKEAANDETKPNPADAIARALQTQRGTTATYLRALPWLARPDFTALTSDQMAALHQINSAIRARTRQLRDETASARPNWAQALGRRPINAREARQWNRAFELAAAYRATHNIRSNNPDQPLGPQPRHHSTRTRSWNHITNEWSNAMPQPDNTSSRPTAADKATVARTAGTSDRQAILDDRARRLRGERQRDVQRRHADNRAKANSDEYSHLDHERLSHDDSNSNSSSLGY